jgi:hypothetical protein
VRVYWACGCMWARVFGRQGYLEVAGAGDDVRFREALNWAGWRGVEEVLLEGGRRGYIGATGASGVGPFCARTAGACEALFRALCSCACFALERRLGVGGVVWTAVIAGRADAVVEGGGIEGGGRGWRAGDALRVVTEVVFGADDK